MGWNSRWDKWVVEKDLMAAGPEALEMQKQLKDKKKKQKVRRNKKDLSRIFRCAAAFTVSVQQHNTVCSGTHRPTSRLRFISGFVRFACGTAEKWNSCN